MLTSILSEEERREYFTEAFVPVGSNLVGKSLRAAGLVKARGFRVIEIVRDGIAIEVQPDVTPLEEGDRMVLACRPSGIAPTQQAAQTGRNQLRKDAFLSDQKTRETGSP